jgi:hypothetical protein
VRGAGETIELVRLDAVGEPRGDAPGGRGVGDEDANEDVRMNEIKSFALAVRSESITATLYEREIDRGVRVTVGVPGGGNEEPAPGERGVPA